MPISVNDLDQSNFSLFGLIPPLISGIKISSESATTDMPLVVDLERNGILLVSDALQAFHLLISRVIFTFAYGFGVELNRAVVYCIAVGR